MSKAEEGLSLVGSGSLATTTSAAKSDPGVIEGGGEGTKRTEPIEPQVELYLSSDDEGDEHAVEKKRNKTTRVNSLLRMRRWVIRQLIHFAPYPPISKEESENSSRIVRSLDKLINALDEVIEAVDDRRGRGGKKQPEERKPPLRITESPAVTKISGDVQNQEKLESWDLAAPPRPTPPLLTPERSHSHQFPIQQNFHWLPIGIIKSTGSTSLHHDHPYATSSQIHPFSASSQIHPFSTSSRICPYSASSQICPYSASSHVCPYSTPSTTRISPPENIYGYNM